MNTASLSTSPSRLAIRKTVTDSTTVIEVDAPRIRFLMIAGSIWLVAWCAGLYGSVAALGLGHRGYFLLDAVLLLWLVFWLIIGLAVLGLVLWGYFGRERLTIADDTLTLQRLIFGVGRKQVFTRSEVGNVRFREVRTDFFGAKSKWSMLGIGAGKVRFDYRGRGYSFGLGLGDDDARWLSEKLSGL